MVRMNTEPSRPLPHLIKPTGLGEDIQIEQLLEHATSAFSSGRSAAILNIEGETPVLVRNEPVRNREKLFPKTPIVNITSAKQALSDTVIFVLILLIFINIIAIQILC